MRLGATVSGHMWAVAWPLCEDTLSAGRQALSYLHRRWGSELAQFLSGLPLPKNCAPCWLGLALELQGQGLAGVCLGSNLPWAPAGRVRAPCPGSSLGPRLGGTQGIWKPCLGNRILRSAGPSPLFTQGAPRLVCFVWCPWGAPPKSSLRGLVAKVGGRAWVSCGPQPTRPEGID